MAEVSDLRCEHCVNPLALAEARPALSWRLQSSVRGARQTAYHVLVADSPAALEADNGTLWDSGKVASDESRFVLYAGKELKTSMRAWWKVMVWDKNDVPSDWSEAARWRMGLLDRSDWQGDWIGTGSKTTERLVFDDGGPRLEDDTAFCSLLLRNEVELSEQPARATAYVAVLGYYELYVSGRRVGDHVLDPAFTDTTRRVSYVTYDVADHLIKGANALGIMLGNGWANLPTPDAWGFYRARWRTKPQCLINILLEYEDGRAETIVTDDSWRWHKGPHVFNCVRCGEIYDARLELPGWNAVDFDDASWNAVECVAPPAGKLVPQMLPPIRVTDTLEAQSVTEPKPGVYVFDFGVNGSGWPRLTIAGGPGQRILMECNEHLNEDGTVDMEHLSQFTFGRFQTDEYILKGDGDEVYEPRFTYHGFRYAQVTGLTGKPDKTTVVARHVHTDLQSHGEFACSEPLINQTHDMARHTFLSNSHGVPTDCPQREKIGWTFDGWQSARSCLFNFDMGLFHLKWLDDILDGQETDGFVAPIHPNPGGWARGAQRADGSPYVHGNDPWFGGVIVRLPWTLYQHTGDLRILDRAFPAMCAYVDYVHRWADGCLALGHGDWLEDGYDYKTFEDGYDYKTFRTPKKLMGTAGYFILASVVGRAAALLGREDEARRYGELADRIRVAFNETFYNPETGRYADDSQTAQALPLAAGLAPEGEEGKILDALADNIVAVRDGHLSVGIIGIRYLFEALFHNGRADLACQILAKTSYPGFGHMIEHGATTIWETWAGPKHWAGSENHPSLGAVDEWFYRGIAGIEPDPTHPGFKHFFIKPVCAGLMNSAQAAFDSPFGRIACAWETKDERFVLKLTVPPNATATVHIPASRVEDVSEGGKRLAEADGVSELLCADGWVVCRASSGQYTFQTQRTNGSHHEH